MVTRLPYCWQGSRAEEEEEKKFDDNHRQHFHYLSDFSAFKRCRMCVLSPKKIHITHEHSQVAMNDIIASSFQIFDVRACVRICVHMRAKNFSQYGRPLLYSQWIKYSNGNFIFISNKLVKISTTSFFFSSILF